MKQESRSGKSGAVFLSLLLAAVAGAAAGGLAVYLAHPEAVPRPRLQQSEFNLGGNEEGFLVTPSMPLELLERFGDFDLRCRVELPEDGQLDLVLRKVEHWGPKDVQMPIFHARFHVLRISTRAEGPGFLSREEALFGDSSGGIRVSAGPPGATVQLEARGKRVRANVNGIDLPWTETIDDFGNFTLVSRQGNVLIHDFKVTPWPAAGWSRPCVWAWAVGAAMAAALFGLFGLLGLLAVPWWRLSICLLLVPLGGWLGGLLVMRHLMVAVPPTFTGLLLAGLCFLPLGLLLTWRRLALALCLGVLAALAMLDLAARCESSHLQLREDARLDLYFGLDSRPSPYEAFIGRIRNEHKVHFVQPKPYDVLLLGGGFLFDHPVPGEVQKNVGLKLPVVLQEKLRRSGADPVLCAAFPTLGSHAYQQLLLFRDFYAEYRPKVAVFGVTDAEKDEDLRWPARQLEPAASARSPSFSPLWELGTQQSAGRAMLQTPEDLEATLVELEELCKGLGSKLLLVNDSSLPTEYLVVLERFALERELPLVKGFSIAEGIFPVEELAAKLVPLLKE